MYVNAVPAVEALGFLGKLHHAVAAISWGSLSGGSSIAVGKHCQAPPLLLHTEPSYHLLLVGLMCLFWHGNRTLHFSLSGRRTHVSPWISAHGLGSPLVLQVIHPEVYGETKVVTHRNLQAGRWCHMSSWWAFLQQFVEFCCHPIVHADHLQVQKCCNSLDKMRCFICNFMQVVHGISSQAHLLSGIVLGICHLRNIPRDKHAVPWHQSPSDLLLVNFWSRAMHVFFFNDGKMLGAVHWYVAVRLFAFPCGPSTAIASSPK